MDFTLRCNSLKCRTQLNDRAVVTTCSHIFCVQCSEHLGLANAAGHRVCPACRTALANPDDVVATQLNPTEDYKTSVLSGLSPTIIMECAGRGLAFWSYQSTQEIVYQEYLAKTLTDKYSNLNHQLDKVIGDANSEIENLNQRLSQLQVDQDKLKTDNTGLLNALREKNRKHAQTQELYDRLKRKEMTAATRNAAYDSADDVLQSAARGQVEGHQPRRQGPSPLGNYAGPRHNRSPERLQHGSFIAGGDRGPMGPPPPPQRQGPSLINHSLSIPHHLSSTPSNAIHNEHRTRLGGPGNTTHPSLLRGNLGAGGTSILSGSTLNGHGQTPRFRRSPLGAISGNANGEIGRDASGYGMSAGMRAGSVQGAAQGLEGVDAWKPY